MINAFTKDLGYFLWFLTGLLMLVGILDLGELTLLSFASTASALASAIIAYIIYRDSSQANNFKIYTDFFSSYSNFCAELKLDYFYIDK